MKISTDELHEFAVTQGYAYLNDLVNLTILDTISSSMHRLPCSATNHDLFELFQLNPFFAPSDYTSVRCRDRPSMDPRSLDWLESRQRNKHYGPKRHGTHQWIIHAPILSYTSTSTSLDTYLSDAFTKGRQTFMPPFIFPSAIPQISYASVSSTRTSQMCSGALRPTIPSDSVVLPPPCC